MVLSSTTKIQPPPVFLNKPPTKLPYINQVSSNPIVTPKTSEVKPYTPKDPVGLVTPKLNNFVATASFTAPNAAKLDLIHLARHCRNVQYHPARFPGILIKVSVPHVTARVFASGKVVLLGAKSKDEAFRGMKVICKMIVKVSGDKTL
jgi:transcription initiation factor TFIID TATA-box-binding protein